MTPREPDRGEGGLARSGPSSRRPPSLDYDFGRTPEELRGREMVWRRGSESRLRLPVKASVALVAVGLALIAAGCGGDDNDDGEATQSRPPPKLVDATAIEGGSARQRKIVRAVVDGMQKTTLTRIEFGKVGAGKGGPRRGVAIAFTTVPGSSVRRQWEEWIVTGALSRRLDAAGLPAEVQATGREGSFTARPKLRGQPDPRPLSRRQEATVVRGLRKAARRSGGDVVRLEVHRPYGAAIALTLAAKSPARFLKTNLRALLTKVGVHRQRLEGIYLAVLDEDKKLALEWGSWTRNRAGSYWVRRDLANCSPIRQSEPPGTEPPPACPA